jgi:hypothetical protein
MSLVDRLRNLARGDGRAKLAWVDEHAVRAGFQRLSTPFENELRSTLVSVDAEADVAYLLFDLRPQCAFDEFPISTWTFDAEGRARDSALDGRRMLQGECLLDPTGSYPLGRADSPIGDTTRDVALVEEVMFDELRKRWIEVAEKPRRFSVLAGVWLTNETWQSHPSQMRDVWTGVPRIYDFLARELE